MAKGYHWFCIDLIQQARYFVIFSMLLNYHPVEDAENCQDNRPFLGCSLPDHLFQILKYAKQKG